jgi:hypothetical protein
VVLQGESLVVLFYSCRVVDDSLVGFAVGSASSSGCSCSCPTVSASTVTRAEGGCRDDRWVEEKQTAEAAVTAAVKRTSGYAGGLPPERLHEHDMAIH